jgi:predicted molibdopterin-dependent oxidoreductase YjgC
MVLKYKNVLTTCPYCGTGCNFFLQVLNDEIVGILPSKSHPVSQGKLCIKGWTANEFLTSKDRLTRPLLRRGGELVPVSWEEALDKIAGNFQECKEKYGPDSLAVLSSAKCTNEENYLMMKFTRAVLGTNNIDHCARL